LRKLIELLSRLLIYLPFKVRKFFGALLAILWFDVLRIRRNVLLQNLAKAFPEMTLARRTSLGRQSLIHMGIGLIDYFLMIDLKKSDLNRFFYVSQETRQKLTAIESSEKGALYLSMHLGNGDFACSALALNGYALSLISKKFKTKWLNRFWFDLRSSHGTKFISEEKSSFDILRALRDKRGVIFVLDQYMGYPIGVKTRFFGHETGTAQGLALFSEKTGLPVHLLYNFRRADGVLVIEVSDPIEFEVGADSKHNRVSMTQKYNDLIEAQVRKHPEQWMWIHRRWKEFREN
jgi:KDO2-lipid IV(A) lauroyltransferase